MTRDVTRERSDKACVHLFGSFFARPDQDAAPDGFSIVVELHAPCNLPHGALILRAYAKPPLQVGDSQLGRLGVLLWVALEGEDGARVVNKALVALDKRQEAHRAGRDVATVVLLHPDYFPVQVGKELLARRGELNLGHSKLPYNTVSLCGIEERLGGEKKKSAQTSGTFVSATSPPKTSEMV